VKKNYFLTPLQISGNAWQSLALQELLQSPPSASLHYQTQLVARQLRQRAAVRTASGGQLQLLALLNDSLRLIAGRLAGHFPDPGPEVLAAFLELYPPAEVLQGAAPQSYLQAPEAPHRQQQMICELLLLATQNDNRAAAPYRDLFHDELLQQRSRYRQRLLLLDRQLQVTPPGRTAGMSLLELLAEPLRAAPDSLAGQLDFVSQRWGTLLPSQLLERFTTALAGAAREFHRPDGGPGRPDPDPGPGLGFPAGAHGEHEPEAFSPDAAWMEQVVMLAKSTLVWLDQLSQRYAQPIQRLDQIPDAELEALAASGVNTLWLIGLWERSSASQRLKQMRGNPEAAASAYALYDYQIAAELGGEAAFQQLRQRCRDHGIRLAGDVVPNHTGLYSRWVKEHPDWYVQLEHPPYPGYRFTGPDLSPDPELGLFIEDGYYDHSDAAVVFKHLDRRNGRVRFIYHGNDGTHMPWNDTAQLDYLRADVREAVIQTILAVARRFPVIRFDAAMTLAKKHFQRLWYPLPGEPTCVPSRHEASLSKAAFDQLFPVEFWREVVDRIAAEVPDTLLLAEAFWLMEGFFVRTLGMHRVYNSAFMNMLKREENAHYRQSLKETLEFNPQILKRFVNFMNNPDEETAVEQFGKGDKYFGVAVLLATLPGLPMFGHGQLEGLTEKYGMEYRRAYRHEAVDDGFLHHHREQIFPLLRNRRLYSGVAHFQLFDFRTAFGIDEHVYAYVNGDRQQRALVLFHNRGGETSGRIQDSVPKRQHGEDRPATRSSLVQALGLPEGSRQLVRYRHHRTGLWHLARLQDWEHSGLQMTLGAYEYALLCDFSPVADSGDWQLLWRNLNGRGVADLDREYRILRTDDLQQAFARLLTPERQAALTRRLQGSKRPEFAPSFVQELNDFYRTWQEVTGLAVDPARSRQQTARLFQAVEQLAQAGRQNKPEHPFLSQLQAGLLASPAGPLTELVYPWLMLAALTAPDGQALPDDDLAWYCGECRLAATGTGTAARTTGIQLLLRYATRLHRSRQAGKPLRKLAADSQLAVLTQAAAPAAAPPALPADFRQALLLCLATLRLAAGRRLLPLPKSWAPLLNAGTRQPGKVDKT
jgi:glycosidase